MWLYHATFRTNLKDIRKFGLGAKQRKNWKISQNNVVCLACDPDIANDYCECAEDVADSVYESGIIVFAVNTNDLDKRYLMQDPNLHDLELYIYRKVIPIHKLYIISSKNGLMGTLDTVKRVPAYCN